MPKPVAARIPNFVEPDVRQALLDSFLQMQRRPHPIPVDMTVQPRPGREPWNRTMVRYTTGYPQLGKGQTFEEFIDLYQKCNW